MLPERLEQWQRERESQPDDSKPERRQFEQCRTRDENIIDLATRHVITPKHVFHLFSSPSAAYRRIGKLRARRKLKHRGTVQRRDGGRPQDVYSNGIQVDPRCLGHEVGLTDFLLCYDEQADIERDPKRVDQLLKPDAEMTFHISNRFFYVEFDTGSEDLPTVENSFVRIATVVTIYSSSPWQTCGCDI